MCVHVYVFGGGGIKLLPLHLDPAWQPVLKLQGSVCVRWDTRSVLAVSIVSCILQVNGACAVVDGVVGHWQLDWLS